MQVRIVIAARGPYSGRRRANCSEFRQIEIVVSISPQLAPCCAGHVPAVALIIPTIG
jgi:hypothetical protein